MGLRSHPNLVKVSSFYSWNVLISSNTSIFGKLLRNHKYFFRVHINQNWHFLRIFTRNGHFFRVFQNYHQIIYKFQSSNKSILVFSENYYQTKQTFQSSYTTILIFYESHYPTIHIFHSRLLTKEQQRLSQSSCRTILRFSENQDQIILTFSRSIW